MNRVFAESNSNASTCDFSFESEKLESLNGECLECHLVKNIMHLKNT